jgi:outer membrane protein assembly factor BamB
LIYYPTGFNTAQIFAVRPDGKGDVTNTHVAWKFGRGVPNKPSLLLLGDVIYMVNDGGIVTSVDAKTGQEIWRSRLLGSYSASPVAADGRIYFFSEDGKATVIDAGREFKVLSENTLESGFMASPAIDGRALYLRTKTHLYRIEEPR